MKRVGLKDPPFFLAGFCGDDVIIIPPIRVVFLRRTKT
jgi:hypothetical protein